MSKLLTLSPTRSENGTLVYDQGFSGLSGKAIALFVGGGFVAALIIFYLIANWDMLGNGFLCFAQDIAGMNTHYHFPMRDGSAYPNCSATVGSGSAGNAGDGNT